MVYTQITPTGVDNGRLQDTTLSVRMAMKSQPNKIRRKEIPLLGTCSNSHNNASLRDLEIPGGSITNSKEKNMRQGIVDLHFSGEPVDSSCIGNTPCVSQVQENALRRVRSAGMIVNKQTYYTTESQFLHSRNRTVIQNEFAMIRNGDPNAIPGTTDALNNKYASNTVSYCPGQIASTPTNYVPVYYKPSNSKYGTQGSVSASARLLRLKYDTVTYGGQKTNTQYGVLTSNALAYYSSESYTLKDKIGFVNKQTPIISKVTGLMTGCEN